jgi:glycosyltransferase involved in cell wall biosynthesis
MNLGAEIKISIALVTRNRPDWLHKCLTSWRAQTPQPYEIIVSDDSDDSARPEVQQIAKQFGAQWVSGPRRGLYANRNNAFCACSGSHIMSADDDHTHPPGFIRTIVQAIQADSEALWTLSERNPMHPDTPHLIPGELRSDGTVGPPKDWNDSAAIACGSTVYPRKIFDNGLRCDETYRFGGLWYLWGHQLRKRGFRIRYCADTFVWHHSETWVEWGKNIDTLKSKTEADLFAHWGVARILRYPPLFVLRLTVATLRSITVGSLQSPERRPVRIPVRSALRAIRRSIRNCPH